MQNAEKTLEVSVLSLFHYDDAAHSPPPPYPTQLKRQYQKRLEDDLEKRRANADEFQHRKDVNDVRYHLLPYRASY